MSRLTFAETKGSCYLAYNAASGESYQFPDGSTWNIIDTWATWISGFQAILLQSKCR